MFQQPGSKLLWALIVKMSVTPKNNRPLQDYFHLNLDCTVNSYIWVQTTTVKLICIRRTDVSSPAKVPPVPVENVTASILPSV